MKKMQLLAVAALLLFACTPDSTIVESPAGYKKISNISPSNPLNPYDNAGAVRNRILDTVFTQLPSGLSNAELLSAINLIANRDNEFAALKSSAFTPLTETALQNYVQSSQTAAQCAGSLGLSSLAQIDFAGFIEGILALRDDDFETIQNYIIGFEAGIIASAGYTQFDKKVILTSTSIERYSNYYRKKPKDKDWILLVGNISAAAQGTTYDTATAILYSVSVEAALHTTL